MAYRKIQRIPRLPRRKRIFTRYGDRPITRDRRLRPIEIGIDPLEARAANVEGTLPERIVYKKLVQLVGEQYISFQRLEGGGRNILGGFVLDFLITDRFPPLVIEVLGDFWHKPSRAFADAERMMAVTNRGYGYFEIWEHEVYHSDELTEKLLSEALGNRGLNRFPSRLLSG